MIGKSQGEDVGARSTMAERRGGYEDCLRRIHLVASRYGTVHRAEV